MDNPSKIPYLNREISWMGFNDRVLEEAAKKENPLMERLRFLAITASNLDEFFMVRVAGVKAHVSSGLKKTDRSGLTPQMLLTALEKETHSFMDKQYSCLNRSILPLLKKEGIVFLDTSEMQEKQLSYISDYFDRVLFPVLTPLAVDSSRPFPMLANRTLNIAVRLKSKEKLDDHENYFAVVQVPSNLPRFIKLPSTQGKFGYVLLEKVIINQLSKLFELHDIKATCPFRLTRNSDMEIDDEAENFLSEVEQSIKRRKRGRPVRLELEHKYDKSTKKFLSDILKIKEKDIYEIAGPIDLTFYFKFAGLTAFSEMCYKPIPPLPAIDFFDTNSIFDAIREKDRMVHLPYETFDPVEQFIQEAAFDENVLAIKQTLYRVSGNSPIIASLIQAAENGKQVTVLVELKARFDEENNLIWAKKLEKAGCHVIYGLQGLKTHCKIALVVRKEDDGIRRYLHLGTGNYNDSTAKIYTDIGIFTCNSQYGSDASSLFNLITGYSRPPEYNHFVVAPQTMRPFFSRMIKREIENATNGLTAGITIKVNSLVDFDLVSKLYLASQAGVKVQLIVRGICCLVPGIESISENITVISIVGRFLEHSRIFKFENAGDPKIYMGSADLMPRNLDKRIELVFPIEDEELKQRSIEILDTLLLDNTNARIMQPDGSYQHVNRRNKPAMSAQNTSYYEIQEALSLRKNISEDKPLKPIYASDIAQNNKSPT